tara:strand:- start:69333 stop:69641 length:309 start_codon:yes stop_codon:yes gene_type:complete
VWIGRVLPLTALLGILLGLHFELDTFVEMLQMSIAVIFGTIAFIWWWWVVDAIKNQNKFFNESYDRFSEMHQNLIDIKTDISRVQKLHVEELEILAKTHKGK